MHQRAADEARQARRFAQRGAEQARCDHRGPDRMLEAARVFFAERFQLLPDLVGKAHFAQRIRDLGAGVGRAGQVLQRGRIERLQHRFRHVRLVQGALPAILGRAPGELLQVSDVDDLPSRGDQLSGRCHQVAGEDGASQREVGHADALLRRRKTLRGAPG